MALPNDPFRTHVTTLQKELDRLKGADFERQQKAVHRIRVMTRRVGVLLRMFPEKAHRKSMERFRRELKVLRCFLGHVREKDVHWRLWEDAGRDRVCFQAVKREIERRRLKAFERFRKKWDGRHFGKILKKAERDWEDGKPPSSPQKTIAGWTSKIIRSPESDDLDSMHDIRLKVKKLRYLLEGLEDGHHLRGAGRRVGLLKEIQKELGFIHDLETFVEFLAKASRRRQDLWDPRTRSDVEKLSEEWNRRLETSVEEWRHRWPERRESLSVIGVSRRRANG